MFYLLALWSRLVSSVPYLKATGGAQWRIHPSSVESAPVERSPHCRLLLRGAGDTPSLLDAHVPAVVGAFLSSRLDSVQQVDGAGAEGDPLDSEDGVQEQLEALPPLLRFQVRFITPMQAMRTEVFPSPQGPSTPRTVRGDVSTSVQPV